MSVDIKNLKDILDAVAKGTKTPEHAMHELRDLPFHDIDIAKLDGHRILRNGFSEVIFCDGKDVGHLIKIIKALKERGLNVFGTRLTEDRADKVISEIKDANYDPISRTITIITKKTDPLPCKVGILCAGTADIPVAEEAGKTLTFFGIEPERFYDVGVAGIHRLMGELSRLREMDVLIVVAGMEGALPSVVGGLVSVPIIAVPTSVGYGANFGGITALCSMLNSCSEGICVVNIDSGFAAACAAIRISRCKTR